MSDERPYGVLAEFDSAEALIEAARRARESGLGPVEAFAPFYVRGLAEAIGFRERRIGWIMFAGGVFGAATGFGVQAYTVLDFPLNIGGRALVPPEGFALITFELLVLFSVLFAVFGMFMLNRLPRLHHPLFNVESFGRATLDGFFLLVRTETPDADIAEIESCLVPLGARSIFEVPR